MKKHFFIFRHGQTIWNAEGRPHGQHSYPAPLTVTGQEQAGKLAEELADKKIKIIITSDLLRAKQTAEIVANALKVDVVEDQRLREVDYGKLNGLYTLEREWAFPDFRKCYEDFDFPFPEGECLQQVADRMLQAIKSYATTYHYRNIGVSTHGHAIEALIRSVFGHKYSSLKNCSYIHITYDHVKDVFEAIKLPEIRESHFQLTDIAY
ncbi:MAG: histidine phosphatase family protein [Alphaproteobacteria bacterium]|nr:histidine phosphatase family protein [Alphaproteobacteria bacterium]